MREENIGYLLWGKVGTGKSYFAGCIANALMEQELSLIHICQRGYHLGGIGDMLVKLQSAAIFQRF